MICQNCKSDVKDDLKTIKAKQTVIESSTNDLEHSLILISYKKVTLGFISSFLALFKAHLAIIALISVLNSPNSIEAKIPSNHCLFADAMPIPLATSENLKN